LPVQDTLNKGSVRVFPIISFSTFCQYKFIP